ncbi:response regulator transcription factor [Roseateles sp. P5_E7]
MFSDHYEALTTAASLEQFSHAMQAICVEAGAERFIALKLRGLGQREVVQVFHSGGPRVEEMLGPPRHLAFDHLVVMLCNAPLRSVFVGAGTEHEVKVDGYSHGAAALARDKRFGCLVLFARRAPAIADAERMQLLSCASLAAQLALAGFATTPLKPCPISSRELNCLRYFVNGYGTKETAQALGISARTVEGHFDRARLRCGVDTTLAAALMALSEGWLEPSEVRRLEGAG